MHVLCIFSRNAQSTWKGLKHLFWNRLVLRNSSVLIFHFLYIFWLWSWGLCCSKSEVIALFCTCLLFIFEDLWIYRVEDFIFTLMNWVMVYLFEIVGILICKLMNKSMVYLFFFLLFHMVNLDIPQLIRKQHLAGLVLSRQDSLQWQ